MNNSSDRRCALCAMLSILNEEVNQPWPSVPVSNRVKCSQNATMSAVNVVFIVF